MAQLRDAKTSEIIFDGDPRVVAKLGIQLGLDNVLFDGVGDGFDAEQLAADHDTHVGDAEKMSKSRTNEVKAAAKTRLSELTTVDEDVAGVVEDAQRALEEARSRVVE